MQFRLSPVQAQQGGKHATHVETFGRNFNCRRSWYWLYGRFPAMQCLALPPPSPTNSPSQTQSPLQPADEVVTFRDNRLINGARGSLEKILAIVPRETGVAFYLKGSAETPITADFEASDLEKGIKRLIRGLNSVFYYGPSQPGAKDIKLTSVLIILNPDSRTVTTIRPSGGRCGRGKTQEQFPTVNWLRTWIGSKRRP